MKNFKSKLIGLSLVGVLFAACNSEFDKVVPESPNLGGIEYKTPKILYIITDGARGESVRDAQIPNMNALLPNAIYSWNSLGDENGLNATNWADMITGVQKDKHNVVSDNFAGNKLADYPAVFSRIKSVNSKIRIALFASTTSFKDKLAAGADVAESLGSDVAVKDKLVDFIKTDTASMIVGQFNDVDVAGNGTEYDIKFPAYKAAIAAFDTRVGEIIAAVKSRPSYAKENWLIIISSNKGGEYPLPVGQDDKTVFSNTKMNTFNIIYNANFNRTFVGKPNVGSFWSGNSPRFLGEPEKTVAITDSKISPSFNFGPDSSFTISIKVKKRKNPNNTSRGDYYYQWPSFMGKRDRAGWGGGNAPGNPGWDLCLFQNGWRFFADGGPDFINGIEIGGANFSGDTWHDLTVVVEKKPDGSQKEYTATNIILATGGRSRELPNLKQDGKKVIGYRQAMVLPEQPKSMVVVGSGAIGVEFAYFYATLGTKVTVVEFMDNVVPVEDEDVSKQLLRSFKKAGIEIMTSSSVESVDTSGAGCKVQVKTASGMQTLECDIVLSAAGVVANIENLGLEETGIKTEKGKVIVDEFYNTTVKGVYAIGDIVGGQALAHVASAEGIICVEKIAGHKPEPLDYNNIPGCTYCSPEIASVGYTEKAAKAAGYELKIGKFPFSASGKASAAGAKDGFVKLIFDAKYGELLGAHMIGANVTEMIAEIVVARKLETTGHEMIKSVHPHPTMSEAIMEAAADAYGEVIHL